MIHFLYGLSSRSIKKNELINSTDKEEIIYFSEENTDLFWNELNSGSLFSTPTLLVLKNANKVKNTNEFISKLNEFAFSDKDIIIDFEANKENKKIKELANNFKFYEILDEKENRKNYIEYITRKLNCNNDDASFLLDVIGDNFESLKNETDKINVFLNGEEYSFKKVEDIISKNSNFVIFNLTDDILSKRNISFPIKEHLGVLATLCNDFEILYKLKLFPNLSNNYNTFKNQISKIELLENYSPYYIFKKLPYLKNFSKEDILKILDRAFDVENNIKSGISPLEDTIETFILEIINR